jgi:microcompartment protein CcmK/EutM
MNRKFQHLEVVKVIGAVVTRKKQRQLTGETGIVVGWSDPDPNGHQDYGVHFNTFGEMISVSEESLQSLGHIADRSEIVTRSRLHQR